MGSFKTGYLFLGRTFSVKSMLKNSADLYGQADKVIINNKALFAVSDTERADHHTREVKCFHCSGVLVEIILLIFFTLV